MKTIADNAWEVPQRQSPAAIFIMLWSTAFKILKGFWPVLALYFFKGEGDENSFSFLWLVLTFVIFSFAGTLIGYWFKKFWVVDDTLVIKTGWFRKKILSIPFQNIQAVHLEQNVWQRFFGVSKVSFDATGSEEVEAQLEALPTAKAEALKDLLSSQGESEHAGKTEPAAANHTYKLRFIDILKLSLTANHLEAFLILVAVGLNLLDELKQIFEFDSQEYIDTYANQVIGQSVLLISILVLGVAFVSVLFSIIRTFIKFYGFSLSDNIKEWKISYGLFNREQKTIPVRKIQILSWRTTWLRRKYNYWIMHVQSVGYKQDQKQNIQIPILDSAKIPALANAYQPYNVEDTSGREGIEAAFWKRKLLVSALPITLFLMAVSVYWLGAWSLAFIVVFLYLGLFYHKFWKNFRWQTQEEGIQIVSGAWGRKITLLNWKKIQQVHIHQGIYQRNHQLADLVFITAGGKVMLPYIQYATAIALADFVLYEVERKNEAWM